MRAGLAGAPVQGRVALGPRAGARVRRLGHEPGTADVGSRGPRQAPLDGFELHVTVWVPPNVTPARGPGGPLTVRSEVSSIDGDCRQGSRLRRARGP